jgi:diguanylate cyclase (GGDEF)-like protein
MFGYYLSIIMIAVTLILVIILGIMTLFLSASRKRNYYFLLVTCLGLILLGTFGELNSSSVVEAFQWVKVFYIGGSFALMVIMLFIFEYSNMKMPIWLIVLLGVISLARVVLFWTTDKTGLIYAKPGADFAGWTYNTEYIKGQSLHTLSYPTGPLFWPFQMYQLAAFIVSIALIAKKIKKVRNSVKTTYYIMAFTITAVLLAEIIYGAITIFSKVGGSFYPTPYTLGVLSVFFFIAFNRYDIINIVDKGNLEVLEMISEPYMLIDDKYNYLYGNKAAKIAFAGLSNLLVGQKIYELQEWPMELLDVQVESEEQYISFGLQSNRGIHYEAHIRKIYAGDHVKLFLIVIQDVTASVNLVKHLEEVANIDILTGSLNRRRFFEVGIQAITVSQQRNISSYVLMFDLDDFKKVNDQYGHLVGDKVLQVFSATVMRIVRDEDLFGRYGGEEFLLLVRDIDKDSVSKLAERIRLGVEKQEVYCDKVCIQITCSIGMVAVGAHETLYEVIDRADSALYVAKRSGKNRVEFGEIKVNE